MNCTKIYRWCGREFWLNWEHNFNLILHQNKPVEKFSHVSFLFFFFFWKIVTSNLPASSRGRWHNRACNLLRNKMVRSRTGRHSQIGPRRRQRKRPRRPTVKRKKKRNRQQKVRIFSEKALQTNGYLKNSSKTQHGRQVKPWNLPSISWKAFWVNVDGLLGELLLSNNWCWI